MGKKNKYQFTTVQIFDAAFKRLMHLSSRAMVCFINGLFGMNFPPESTVTYPNTEQIKQNMKSQHSDIILCINGTHYFLIEAQIKNDSTMIIRVFSYSYEFALQNKSVEGSITTIELPRAMVIYLNPNQNTPYSETLRIKFPDGATQDYVVDSFRLLDYTLEELEERNMILLTPFYMLKLRGKFDRIKDAAEKELAFKELLEMVEKITQIYERAGEIGNLSPSDLEEVVHMYELIEQHLDSDEIEESPEDFEKRINEYIDSIPRTFSKRAEAIKRMRKAQEEQIAKDAMLEEQESVRLQGLWEGRSEVFQILKTAFPEDQLRSVLEEHGIKLNAA